MISSLYKIEREVLYNELSFIFERLKTIPYAIIKGEVLSEQIYGIPDKRHSNDIDILVENVNVKIVENLLKEYGFYQCNVNENKNSRYTRVMCMTYSHQIPSYHKEKYGFHLNIDINHDIFWGEYGGKRISLDEFLSDTVEMNIYGVNVKTLTLEKTFVQIILHHYKEMNSLFHLSQHNTITSDMFADIFGLLVRNSNILTIDCVQSICEKYSIGTYVYYMLYYTNIVFKNKLLEKYIDHLKSYRNEKIMESYGLSQDEQKRWVLPFEKRLNNKELPKYVCKQLSNVDYYKIESNKKIFQ